MGKILIDEDSYDSLIHRLQIINTIFEKISKTSKNDVFALMDDYKRYSALLKEERENIQNITTLSTIGALKMENYDNEDAIIDKFQQIEDKIQKLQNSFDKIIRSFNEYNVPLSLFIDDINRANENIVQITNIQINKENI